MTPKAASGLIIKGYDQTGSEGRRRRERIERKRAEADLAFHRVGITFAVYGEEAGKDRLIPFDIIPRIIPAPEWKALQKGMQASGSRR
jgi:uncharacterized circularly permuted ATP-grasp superfamily protein